MTQRHLLAINTVSGSCSVAVSINNTVLTKKTIIVDKGHSEILMPLIENVLDESKIKINELSGFLVCTGPGNYTSLRVAISAIRGLSLACNKPACGISLFELLSMNKPKELVLIKGPAEKIYVQSFKWGVRESEPKLMTLNEIKKNHEFFNFETTGYRAKEIRNLIRGIDHENLTDISFKKFFTMGLEKFKNHCPKPVPIYIK